MPYQYLGKDKVFKADEDREEIRPSGLRIVQSVFRARRSSVDKAVEEAKKSRDGLIIFPSPSISFSNGFCAVSAVYYGIAPGRESSPYIERGREEGRLGFRSRQAFNRPLPNAFGSAALVGGEGFLGAGFSFSFPWTQKALCPTIRYVYVKNQQSAYLKHSHPKVTTASLDIPRSDERYARIEYGELYANWYQTNSEEQNFGEFTEVTETFKFSSVRS